MEYLSGRVDARQENAARMNIPPQSITITAIFENLMETLRPACTAAKPAFQVAAGAVVCDVG
jgi:hypothetical protein